MSCTLIIGGTRGGEVLRRTRGDRPRSILLLHGEDHVARAGVARRVLDTQHQHIGPRLQRLRLEAERLLLAVEQAVRREDVDPLLAVDRERRRRSAAPADRSPVASMTAWSPSTPATFTVTAGGAWLTANGVADPLAGQGLARRVVLAVAGHHLQPVDARGRRRRVPLVVASCRGPLPAAPSSSSRPCGRTGCRSARPRWRPSADHLSLSFFGLSRSTASRSGTSTFVTSGAWFVVA